MPIPTEPVGSLPRPTKLQEAIKASPDNPTYRYHLAMAYQKNNDKGQAREQLERALQLNPPPSLADEIRKTLAEDAGP